MSGAFDLLEHVPVPAYVFRVMEGDFVLEGVNAASRAVNPAISGMLGRSMTHLYADQPQAYEDATRAVREGATVVREMAVRRYDRTEATLLVRLSYVFVAPHHLMIFMENISTPPIAEAALRESESRYRSLIESLPDAVLARGVDGRVIACNEIAARLFGAKSEFDLLGAMDVLPRGAVVRTENGEAVQPAELPSLRVLATGEPEVGHAYAFSLSGRDTRWVRVAARPIRSGAGVLSGSVATYTDITDRVEAQKALRESSARLDLALAAAKMGIWEIDPQTTTGTWSKNLNSIFRLSAHADSVREFIRCIHPDDRTPVLASAERAAASGHGNTFEQEFRVVGEDGESRWARVFGRASGDSGHVLLAGTLMDVTEQHRLEEELRRAHRLESIGRLAGGIAHDFNNLLAAMLGSLELMEEQCPPGAREDLGTIRHAATRATELTRQLLAFARKQPVTYKVVDLSAMVSKVERMLRRLVGPDIDLSISSGEGIHVRADPSLLEQVLVNLVINSREAMPHGGKVEIRVGTRLHGIPAAGTSKDYAMLEVSDSGIGMDEETRAKIFDPFFTTKNTGTGLGLASSYGIVKQHGGHILVDTKPGHGTRFRVLLPLVDSEAAKAAHSSSPSPAPGKGCILVVDDEELVRNTTVRMLKSLGYTVLTAESGEQALDRARTYEGRIDALVCDVAMPGMDGPATAKALERERPGLRVLFASGYMTTAEDESLSGKAFLPKPYTRADLAAKLGELFAEG